MLHRGDPGRDGDNGTPGAVGAKGPSGDPGPSGPRGNAVRFLLHSLLNMNLFFSGTHRPKRREEDHLELKELVVAMVLMVSVVPRGLLELMAKME